MKSKSNLTGRNFFWLTGSARRCCTLVNGVFLVKWDPVDKILLFFLLLWTLDKIWQSNRRLLPAGILPHEEPC